MNYGPSVSSVLNFKKLRVMSVQLSSQTLLLFMFFLMGILGSVVLADEGVSSEDPRQCIKLNAHPVLMSETGSEETVQPEPDSSAGNLSRHEDVGVHVHSLHSLQEKLQIEDAKVPSAEEEPEPLIAESDFGQDIGIPLVFNDAVEHYIRYFTTTKRELFKKWLKRKKRYAPLMKEILQEQGLPEDLVYLAMIESGFNLHAYSPMKAAGPWQFIPETGRRYGLAVNHWVDERRDIRKSTVAAARYLQELFDQFGCWYLAAAGYNAGENRIDRLIKRYDTKDFWQLRAYNTLPRETREYVPQLIAAATIAQNPELYGLGDIEDVPAFEFIKVNVPGGMPLEAIAKAASIDVSSIKSLNPEIRRGITPPGKNYGIKLPSETDIVTFRLSLSEILHKEKRVVGAFAHRIGRRDNARKIIKRYGVSKEDLTLVNGKSISFKKGALVYIPRFENTKRAKAITADFRRKTSGESFQDEGSTGTASYLNKGQAKPGITAKTGKSQQSIKHDNHMKIPRSKRGKQPSLASYSKKISRKASKKFHQVQRGDTLWRIAKKYGKSVNEIKTMNNLKGNEIHRGKRLRVSSFSLKAGSLSA